MKYLTVRKIGKWAALFALFAGFSSSPVMSHDLVRIEPSTPDGSRGMDPVILTFNCIDGQPGDTICIPVTVENFDSIVIAQLEIIWDNDVLDFIDVQNSGTPEINLNADFNQSGPNALKFIPLNLNPFDGVTLPDGTVLFEICFRIIGVPGSSSCIGISPFFEYEIADVNGQVAADSVGCCMTVNDVVNLVGFVTSCGPDMAGNNGAIDIAVYGGTAPYTITWVETISGTPGGPVNIPAEGGTTVLNVPAGNYNILVTDVLGSTVMYTAEVDAVGISVTTVIKHPTCYKFENGTITIKPEDGSAPFSYIWESLTSSEFAGSGFIRNPGDSSKITSLEYGIYSITVEDNNGCKVVFLDTLIENPFVFTINDFQHATCNGSADGYIDLTISGATPNPSDGSYTILVMPGFELQSNMITIGLKNPGDYCITVSDEVSQCDTVYCFTIGYTDTITASVTTTDVPCFGGTNGMVTLRGRTNGLPGPSYSYSIYENGILVTSAMSAGNFTYGPLHAGTYAAIVSEGPCQSDSIFFTINEPPPITVSLVGTTIDNCLDFFATGDAWFSIMNGNAPFMLDAGSGFQDGDTIFNLNDGNYILTVTDDNGCTATTSFTIVDGAANEEADITFAIDGIPCEGGTVAVLYQGMPIPPNIGIVWSTGEVNDTIVITETDTLNVDVLVTTLNCFLSDTVHINCVVQVDLDITVTQPLCGEGALGGPYTGTVIADTLNATAPVTWYWSFGDTTTTGIYTGLAPGKYYVTVVDGLDSTAVDSFEIIAPPTLGFDFSNIDSTSCPATCDGGAQILPLNGDPSMDYFLYWDPVNPQADTGFFFGVTDLCAGFNVFTLSQDGNCFFVDSVEIIAPDSVEIDLVQVIDVSCYGLADGSLEVTATGGTPGYSYAWVNGPPAPGHSGLTTGYHTVMVTDSRNCVAADSFFIAQPDTLIADIDSSATFNLSCGASDDGVITVEVSGGNLGQYNYAWNPNVSTTYQAANLSAGNYTITVSDSRGCSDTTSFLLSSPPPVVVSWPVLASPECFGDESEFAIESVTGGSGVYQYTINSGEIHEINEIVDLPAGIYIISVFDDRGCEVDTTYTLMQPNPIMVSIGPDDPVIDLGDSLYIIGTILQSDNPIATTLWTSDEPLSCATCDGTWVFNSFPTLYTWTVTDINGCTGSASILVDVDYDRDVFLPNIFSPNSDGRNDDFRVFSGPGVEVINYIRIYDRWGNVVHTQTGLLPSQTGAGNWDGTYDGQELNPGVYVYVVEIKFIDGQTLRFRGDVTLVK